MLKKTIFVLLAILNLSNLSAQQQISLRQIPEVHQLPSNSAPRVLQDSEGYMWFGTLDGLCRYDGYRLMVLRSDFNNINMLSNNEITCMVEDKHNNIIIGTKAGVDILDKKTYKLTRLRGSEVEGREIKSLAALPDGSIWIGTRSELLKYNSDFTLHRNYNDCLAQTSINSIFQDKDGSVWVALWQSGLHRYDPINDTFIHYPRIGLTDNPFRLFQDKDSRLWICTWGEGMVLFTPGLENPYRHTQIMTPAGVLPENLFFSIVQDDLYGYLWVVSTTGLHAIKVLPDGRLQNVDIAGVMHKSNNIFSEIVKDRDGMLWVGSFGEGVFTISFRAKQIENFPLDFIKAKTEFTSSITSLFVDNQSRIWLNQNRKGLFIYDQKKDSGVFYKEIPALASLEGLDIVSCISALRSEPNKIWLGPENMSIIYCVNGRGNTVERVESIDLSAIKGVEGRDVHPRLFYEDNIGNMWIATTAGIIVKQPESALPVLINSEITNATGIAEDCSGNMWISDRTKGVCVVSKIDRQLVRTYSRESGDLPTNSIETICAQDDCIWIGAKEGNILTLASSSDKNGKFTDISKSFRISGKSILKIIADDQKHLWVVTNQSVTEYNPHNRAQMVYSVSDGLTTTSFMMNSCFKTASGHMLFGGNNGFSLFSHSNDLTSAHATKVAVTDVKVNNRSLLGSSEGGTFDPLSQRLILEPHSKNIEIDFSSFDYTYPSKVQFAYRMEGVDDGWIYTDDNRQFAAYNTLGKGWRTFYVKATDENNLWNDEITKVRIYKCPAWYESWWAYCLYVIIASGLIYMTFRTVRNRIKLKNELKISNIEKQKGEELTQAKLRYFTNISHDFLTPLTIMSCVVDDVETTGNFESTQLGILRSNSARLKRLLQQILDFRRVESGNMRLKLSQGDIAKFVRELCYSNFIPLIKKKGLRFSFDAQPEVIEAVFDADKIDKIIFNLLSNAIKYTPEQAEVAVSLRQYENNGNSCLRIEVKDTGCGISEQEQKQIFTRFYTNTVGKQDQTNGVGLSLTKELVEIHNGTIEVESTLGEGACFIVNIMIDRSSYTQPENNDVAMLDWDITDFADDNKSVEANNSQTNDDPEQANDTTILLVEDNEELLGLMEHLLSKHYNILTALNGREGLAVVETNNVDIIVSDIMMPEMDGMEFCRQLKAGISTSHIPIILLTAKDSTECRIECYDAGVDGYISKPFSLQVLEARIKNFIRIRRSRQQLSREGDNQVIPPIQFTSHDEQILNHTIAIIEENIMEEFFDINILAEKLHMSKSTLYRKIKSMTGMSPVEYVRNIKLKYACRILKDSSITISEVAYACGFMNPKYFSTCFRQEFGLTPSEYQIKNKSEGQH